MLALIELYDIKIYIIKINNVLLKNKQLYLFITFQVNILLFLIFFLI